MSLLTLDRPIAFQRIFVTLTGSVNAALMLSQMVYWHNRVNNPDDWFYKTEAEWEEETGLTRKEQSSAREKLIACEVIQVERKGVPARLFYRIDEDRLRAILDALERFSSCAKRNSQLSENAQQDVPKGNNKMYQKRTTITETTQETTTVDSSLRSESKSDAGAKSAPSQTLPDWLPLDAWNAYVDMRKKIKKPMTEYAMSLAISALMKLRISGHDPGEVINQSVLNSWQGLFPVRGNPARSPTSSEKFDPVAYMSRERNPHGFGNRTQDDIIDVQGERVA